MLNFFVVRSFGARQGIPNESPVHDRPPAGWEVKFIGVGVGGGGVKVVVLCCEGLQAASYRLCGPPTDVVFLIALEVTLNHAAEIAPFNAIWQASSAKVQTNRGVILIAVDFFFWALWTTTSSSQPASQSDVQHFVFGFS